MWPFYTFANTKSAYYNIQKGPKKNETERRMRFLESNLHYLAATCFNRIEAFRNFKYVPTKRTLK